MDTEDKSQTRHGEKAVEPAALSASLVARKGSATSQGFAGDPPKAPSQTSTAGSVSAEETDSQTRSVEERHCGHADIAGPGDERRPERSETVYIARRVVDKEVKAESVPAPREGGKTILVVEDYPLNTKLFRELLEIAGYRTLQTSNGVTAFEMTKTHKPDLILMDIRLPEVSGLEVAQWIRQDPELRHTPIVAVTAFAMEGDESRILSAGCSAYLRKPISIASFMATIRGFLEEPETDSR